MGPPRRARTHDRLDPGHYEARRSGHFEDRRVSLIDSALRSTRASTVIELGSGTGKVTSRLAGMHPGVRFYGVDVDARLLGFARREHPAGNVEWCDTLPDVSADVCFGIDVIHHLHDRPRVFADVSAALRTGGVWTVIEPNIWHPAIAFSQERMRRSGLDEDHFRPWQVEPEFTAAGFEIVERTYAHLWPASLRKPPRWARQAETRLERRVGASVIYRLRRVARSATTR